jgi:hypothetical protein
MFHICLSGLSYTCIFVTISVYTKTARCRVFADIYVTNILQLRMDRISKWTKSVTNIIIIVIIIIIIISSSSSSSSSRSSSIDLRHYRVTCIVLLPSIKF